MKTFCTGIGGWVDVQLPDGPPIRIPVESVNALEGADFALLSQGASSHPRPRAEEAGPECDTDQDPDRVERDVEGRARASGDERLVDLVRDRVGHAQRECEPGPRGARTSSAPSTAYSAACAIFRRTTSHTPSPVLRSGTMRRRKSARPTRGPGARAGGSGRDPGVWHRQAWSH